MQPIRVLLADDHALVRAGFRSLLEKLGIQVVGEAADGNQVMRLVETLKPAVVLMDIAMPELNGLEATARIGQAFPKVRVVILSMHATVEYARRALHAGAMGYLLKDSSATELNQAIQAAARGETYLCARISQYLVADGPQRGQPAPHALALLTARQREVLQLIAEGHARKAIAEKLNISAKTFDTHRAQIMERLDIHDLAGLVRFAARVGLTPPDE